jgi:hypothetical protein
MHRFFLSGLEGRRGGELGHAEAESFLL